MSEPGCSWEGPGSWPRVPPCMRINRWRYACPPCAAKIAKALEAAKEKDASQQQSSLVLGPDLNEVFEKLGEDCIDNKVKDTQMELKELKEFKELEAAKCGTPSTTQVASGSRSGS